MNEISERRRIAINTAKNLSKIIGRYNKLSEEEKIYLISECFNSAVNDPLHGGLIKRTCLHWNIQRMSELLEFILILGPTPLYIRLGAGITAGELELLDCI